jgi:hypothetical protein
MPFAPGPYLTLRLLLCSKLRLHFKQHLPLLMHKCLCTNVGEFSKIYNSSSQSIK